MTKPLGLMRMAVALGTAALVTAACGSSDGGTQNTGANPSASISKQSQSKDLASKLPADIRKAGVVNVATDASYPPVESVAPDGKTIVGIDVDLANAMGQLLGVKLQFKNTGFDGIIPSLLAGRFDISMSAVTDNLEREKQVDFVDYFKAGTGMLVKKGNPEGIKGISDLCGKTGAVEKGTIQDKQLREQSTKCQQGGKPAVTVKTFPDQNGANLALRTGRADIVVADFPVIIYSADKSKGQLEALDVNYGTAPYGIVVPKKSTQLRDALQAALQELMDNGTYEQILEKWDVKSGAIDKATVNGASS